VEAVTVIAILALSGVGVLALLAEYGWKRLVERLMCRASRDTSWAWKD
jgi:hypothetical protein